MVQRPTGEGPGTPFTGRGGTSPIGTTSANTGSTAATNSTYGGGAFASGLNFQSGAAYVVQNTDYQGVILFNTASPVAVSLNSAVDQNFTCQIVNLGSGAITLIPTEYMVNGGSSLVLGSGVGVTIYFANREWSAFSGAQYVNQVSVNSVTVPNPNFNDSSPAASLNYQNIQWQHLGSEVSAEVPYGSSSVFGVVKVDNTTITASAGVISAVTPAAVNFADSETPSGVIDGANKTFTLANAPNPALSLQLFVEPMGFFSTLEIQGIDYTLSGLTITMTTAPSVGQVIRAWYRH